MPDTLFEVTCKQCGGSLVTTKRIRDAEIAVVEDHLRACCPLDPLGNAPPLGEIMARIRVACVERA